MGIPVRISGNRAFFPRMEFERDRVTHALITPANARGVLQRVHWRPTIRWIVERITVVAPIRYRELGGGVGGGPGRTLILTDVDYVVSARFELGSNARPEETTGEHLALFRRRIARPDRTVECYLGRPDYRAELRLLTHSDIDVHPDWRGTIDLGWLPADVLYTSGAPAYFRAIAVDGVIEVPPHDGDQLYR